MAQNKREIVLGLQLGQTHIQLTRWDNSLKEPVSVEEGERGEDRLRTPQEVWGCFEKGRSTKKLSEYLREYFVRSLGNVDFSQVKIMVTLRHLEDCFWEKVPEALEQLGIERKNIYLQDYRASFFYYTVNSRKDLWKGDVALLEYRDEEMAGYLLHIDRSKTPSPAQVTDVIRQKVDAKARDGRSDVDWDKERDRLLFELLKKLFERRNVTTVYIVSNYYNKSWAQKSFQFMCQNRHAFQGHNLFSRGACFSAMERSGAIVPSGIVYIGRDVIRVNMGMNLRVNGKESLYPLISAGTNWYDAHFEGDLIPSGENCLTVISTPMAQGEQTAHVLRLKGMPKRPDRASRLHLTVFFTSPGTCEVEVEDLGFGGFAKPSGKTWTRKIWL